MTMLSSGLGGDYFGISFGTGGVSLEYGDSPQSKASIGVPNMGDYYDFDWDQDRGVFDNIAVNAGAVISGTVDLVSDTTAEIMEPVNEAGGIVPYIGGEAIDAGRDYLEEKILEERRRLQERLTGGEPNAQAPTTQYPGPTTQYPTPTTQYPTPTTQYPGPTTQYLTNRQAQANQNQGGGAGGSALLPLLAIPALFFLMR